MRFYTTVLGFEKKDDVAMGQLRWLTVSSPEGLEGTELVLELTDFPPSQTYRKARFATHVRVPEPHPLGP